MSLDSPRKTLSDSEFDEYVDRCLSMVMHHQEIIEISALIKKVYHDKNGLAGDMTGD